MFIALFDFKSKRSLGGGLIFYLGHLLLFVLAIIIMYVVWAVFFGSSLPPVPEGSSASDAYMHGHDHGRSFIDSNKTLIVIFATVYSTLISILICSLKSLRFWYYFYVPLTALLSFLGGFYLGLIPSIFLITRWPTEQAYSSEHEIYNFDRY